MRGKKRLFYPLLLALVATFFAGQARADLYWETRSVSVNISGQSNGNSIQRYYFTPYASRVELGAGNVTIVRYKSMKLFLLNAGKRSCTEINLKKLPQIPGMEGENQKELAQMLGGVMGTQVHPVDRYETIAGYRCREYHVRIAIVNGEYWVSKDVEGYRELKAIGREAEEVAEYNPLFRQVDIAGLVRKLDGFPVRTVNHVMGGTVTTTLTKIVRSPLDPALFTIPRNYTMKKML
ncbi:MAG: DUF4412 domain-containing protein [Syntrophobacteraceae bacterium]|nr:DUF4412 domain-containing protein [Syntrophobacteraceae bacterium]